MIGCATLPTANRSSSSSYSPIWVTYGYQDECWTPLIVEGGPLFCADAKLPVPESDGLFDFVINDGNRTFSKGSLLDDFKVVVYNDNVGVKYPFFSLGISNKSNPSFLANSIALFIAIEPRFPPSLPITWTSKALILSLAFGPWGLLLLWK